VLPSVFGPMPLSPARTGNEERVDKKAFFANDENFMRAHSK
jgi:hypothetical protein